MRREQILREVKADLPYAIRLREQFHRYPELAFQEYRTSEIIEQELKIQNIPYCKVGQTGIVAVIENSKKKNAKTIAIRTDMDALPLQEKTNLPFKSCNLNMHACGHDLHMAMVLGAGKLLNRKKDRLEGNVKLIFQPAEEIGQGAKIMADSGLLQDVDTILALHMDPQEETGIFHTGYGARTSTGCCVEISLAACAEKLYEVAAEIINRIANKIPMMIKKEHLFAFSPTVIKACDKTHLTIFYDGRIFTDEDGEQIEHTVQGIVREVEKKYPINVRLKVERIGESVQNNSTAVETTVKIISELFGKGAVKFSGPSMFGEDFYYYRNVANKLVFSTLGGSEGEKEYPLHSNKVNFSNSALFFGIAYYLGYIEEYFR